MTNAKPLLAKLCLVLAVVVAITGVAFTWALVDQYGSQALSTLAMFAVPALLLLLGWYLLRPRKP